MNSPLQRSPLASSRFARAQEEWDAKRVRALRQFLDLTQAEFSQLLGARQQTISEWEIGKHRPRGTSIVVLNTVAVASGFDPEISGALSSVRHTR